MVWVWVSESLNWDSWFVFLAKTVCMGPPMCWEVRSEPILFLKVFWWREGSVASTFRLTACIYCRHYLAFRLGEAARHMSSSFSFKHKATNVKIGWYGFMSFDFYTETPVSNILYACWSWNSMIWQDKPKESLKTHFICQFFKFVVVSYTHVDSVPVHSNHFLLFEWQFDTEVQLNGHAVTQN